MASVLSSFAFLRVTYLISVCLAHKWEVKLSKTEHKFQVLTGKSQISLLRFVLSQNFQGYF